MPRYDFSCATCGEYFERQLPFNSTLAAVICPRGHNTVRRVYSAPLVVYKGSGWYITDHKSPGESAISSTEAG